MRIKSISRSRIHFKKEHEWIDFNGMVGFVGLSAFKLLDIKKHFENYIGNDVTHSVIAVRKLKKAKSVFAPWLKPSLK